MAFTTGFWVGGMIGTAERMNNCLLGWGLLTEFPVADTSNKGSMSLATDKGMIYRSDGTAWIPTAITPPATPEQGQVMYFNGTSWVALPPGTAGQVLTTNGPGANPVWGTVASGGATQTAVSRTWNTNYQNTSGKTMIVTVVGNIEKTSTNQLGNGMINLACGVSTTTLRGVATLEFAPAPASSNGWITGSMTAVVPPDWYYRIERSYTSGVACYIYGTTEWILG